MNRSLLLSAVCAVMFSFIATSANATLVSRLGGLAYYDTDADLTWLANANASGSFMQWSDAMNWAANLKVAGVTGWRLPTTSDTDCRFGCTGSEMGNLFYNVSLSLFTGVQLDYYWSSTKYALNPANVAWAFNMQNGRQDPDGKTGYNYAWAVHSGDVGAVPIPPALWLLGSGLLGLIGVARKKTT